MAATPTPKPSRRSSLDLVIVLVLILVLVGVTLVSGRARRQAGSAAPAALTAVAQPDVQRLVLPEQVGYRELAAFAFPDKIRAVAVGPDDHLFVSTGFFIVELGADGTEVRRFELQTAAGCLAVVGDLAYLGCGDHLELLALADGKITAWPSVGADAFLVSVAVSRDLVIAGDAGRRRFVRWRLDGTSLPEITPPAPPTDKGVSASVPTTYFDLAADPDGTFWATDVGSFGVVHFDGEGRHLGRFGKGSAAIEDFGSCCNPAQIALAPGGLLVTVEKKPDLVKTYRRDGTFASVVAGPKAFQDKTFVPDVAADAKGRIVLVDPKAKSLRRFEPKTEAPAP